MSKKINFSADRKSASEGEYVTLSWDCGMPDAVTLTIDNGYHTSRIQLPDSGSRTVLVEKSKGKTLYRLVVAQGTTKESCEVVVKVKNLKTIHAKEYRPKSHNHLSISDLLNRIRSWWRSFSQRLAYGWRVMPPRQKKWYKIILIALAIMWIGSLWRNAGYRAGYEQGLRDREQIESTYKTPYDTTTPDTNTTTYDTATPQHSI